MKFCMLIPCGRGSVLLQIRFATLCTSGFRDDVTFGRNGRNAKRWRLTCAATTMNGVAIPWWSLMSMNVCFVLLARTIFSIFVFLVYVVFCFLVFDCQYQCN